MRERLTKGGTVMCTPPIALVSFGLAFTLSCSDVPTEALDPEASGTAPLAKQGNSGKEKPGRWDRGTSLDATLRDDDSDGIRSDGDPYRDGEDSDGDGKADTFVILYDSGGIELRLDQGTTRRFWVGGGSDTDPLETALLEDGCENPCTGPGHFVGFINMRDGAGSLDGGFLDVTAATVGATSEMHVRWYTDTDEWVLRYGTDCDMNRDELTSLNRVAITALDDAQGWEVESDGKAFLCRKALKGRPSTMALGEFPVPVGVEFRLQ